MILNYPKSREMSATEVDVCISPIDSQKYAYLAECKELTKVWPLSRNRSVCDRISNKMSNLKHDLIVSVHYGSFRSD